MKRIIVLVVVATSLLLSTNSFAERVQYPQNNQEVDAIALARTGGCTQYGNFPNTTDKSVALEKFRKLVPEHLFNFSNVVISKTCHKTAYARSWVAGSATDYNSQSAIQVAEGEEYVDLYINTTAFLTPGFNGTIKFSNIMPSENDGTNNVLTIMPGSSPSTFKAAGIGPKFTEIPADRSVRVRLNLSRRGWNRRAGSPHTTVLSILTCNDPYDGNIPKDIAHKNAKDNFNVFIDQNGNPGRARCDDFRTTIKIHVVPNPNNGVPKAVNNLNATTKLFIAKNGERELNSSDNHWFNGVTPNVRVGETVLFNHQVSGDVYMSDKSSVTGRWETSQKITEFDGKITNKTIASKNNINFGRELKGVAVKQGNINDPKNNAIEEFYRVKSSDRGKTICRNIRSTVEHIEAYTWTVVNPTLGSSNSTETRYSRPKVNGGGVIVGGHPTVILVESSPACFYVPFDGVPPICVSNDGKNNCGNTTDCPQGCGGRTYDFCMVGESDCGSTPVIPGQKFKVTQFTIPRDFEDHEENPGGGDVGRNSTLRPCAFYDQDFKRISGSGRIENCITDPRDYSTRSDIPLKEFTPREDAPIGQRYCVAISFNPDGLEFDQTAQQQKDRLGKYWQHAKAYCVLISKKPNFAVWGSGMVAGRAIRTNRNLYSDGKIFGSWVEFESITGGRVGNFTSGGSNVNYPMTFANNSSNSSDYGQFEPSANILTRINIIFNQFKNRFAPGVLSGDVTYSSASQSVNGGATVTSGGRVYIDKDIKKSNINEQFVVVSDGDIYIGKDVTRIDAILLARGRIITCANGFSNDRNYMKDENCEKQLIFNAPVIASDGLRLYRTHGSGYNSKNVPAEVFNYRLDNYLWSANNYSSNLKTTFTRELPVRY